MKYTALLLALFVLVSCSKEPLKKDISKEINSTEAIKIIELKNSTLSQNSALSYFFYSEGIDTEIEEPMAEVESDYFYRLKNSQENFIFANSLKKSNIVQISDNYILMILNSNNSYSPLAATFTHKGVPINFLLLSYSFGTNEFSIHRDYELVKQNIFRLKDIRNDVEWINFPTEGVSKLTSQTDVNITIDKEGYFHAKKF